MAVPTSEIVTLIAYMSKGAQNVEQKLLDHNDDDRTCNVVYEKLIELALSASNTSLDLSAEMSVCRAFSIKEVTSGGTTGAKWAPNNGATKLTMLPGDVAFQTLPSTGTPPTLYFDNPSASDKAYLKVVAVGTRS